MHGIGISTKSDDFTKRFYKTKLNLIGCYTVTESAYRGVEGTQIMDRVRPDMHIYIQTISQPEYWHWFYTVYRRFRWLCWFVWSPWPCWAESRFLTQCFPRGHFFLFTMHWYRKSCHCISSWHTSTFVVNCLSASTPDFLLRVVNLARVAASRWQIRCISNSAWVCHK